MIKKILLMGNPNVGKSVVFSRLTGVEVIASNYPGTTVEFCKGCIGKAEQKADVIDVPGTYSLEPTSPAEKVAVEMLDKAIEEKDSIVIDVVDATNLERNLNVTLQLLKKKIPVIIALNLWDEAKHIGISIDVKKLEQILGVPIVPTVAITGEGIKQLVTRLGEAKKGQYKYDDKERWHEIGNIVEKVQVIEHRHHTILERIGDLTVHPWTGIPIAVGVMYVVFTVIRFIGEGLIGYVFEPLFENIWLPVMMAFSRVL
jgi:ferrous iron transport protein B